jgi:hypothetical protein
MGFTQGAIGADLCTSCAGKAAPVEDGGNPIRQVRKAAKEASLGAKEVRNRLRARIFTVDIRHNESTIRAIRFPNSALTLLQSRFRLGANETCKEKL